VVALTETGLRYPARRHTLMRRWRDQMGFAVRPD